MKSMRQMQMEMFLAHQQMPKDKDGFPKLKISFGGVVRIVRDKECEDWERRFNIKATIVTGIIFVLVACGIYIF